MPTTTDVKLSKLNYVILYVSDMNKAVAFYRDKLGMTVKVQEGDWSELETGSTTVALHGTTEPVAPGKNCTVFGVDDITQAYEALKAKGVVFTAEPKMVCEAEGKVGKGADFRDPDGNILSIFGYSKK